MPNATPKPVRMWCVVNPNNDIYEWTMAPTKKHAIGRMLFDSIDDWPLWRKQGYRCLPVLVSPVMKGKRNG